MDVVRMLPYMCPWGAMTSPPQTVARNQSLYTRLMMRYKLRMATACSRGKGGQPVKLGTKATIVMHMKMHIRITY